MTVVEPGRRRGGGRGLAAWLARAAPRRAAGRATVAIVSDRHIRSLNRRYRGKDAVTDVLSFPAGAGSTEDGVRFLGDIVIARETAQKQAKTSGHPVGVEFRVLALHGLLHLLGYDHEVDAGRMARLETRLRRRAGLPLGLIARSQRDR